MNDEQMMLLEDILESVTAPKSSGIDIGIDTDIDIDIDQMAHDKSFLTQMNSLCKLRALAYSSSLKCLCIKS